MQILTATKKHALSEAHIGCVGAVASLNVARGCAGRCAFCYARCYTGAPPAGQLLVYADLPGLLRHELDSSHRRAPLPGFVVLSTATDGFLGGPPLAQVSRACLEILLNRRIAVSLSTRGAIPEDTLVLLGRCAPQVQITVSLVSLSESYTRSWEPGTALPQQRLFLVQRLLQLGIRPRVRLEPVIPFVNDHTDELRALLSALKGLGLTDATISFLQLRRGVREQLAGEAPPELRRLVLGCFPEAESPAVAQHLPEKQALSGLRRIQRIGREHGVRISACHCQNPGVPAGRCPIVPAQIPTARGAQTQLFEADPSDAKG